MTRRRRLLFAVGLGTWALQRASLAQPAAGPQRIGWVSVADPGIRVEEFRGGLRELG